MRAISLMLFVTPALFCAGTSTANAQKADYEIGARGWVSDARVKEQLNLVGPGGSASVSSTGTIPAHSGELFGRATFGNWFVKGYAGLGSLNEDKVKDPETATTAGTTSTSSNESSIKGDLSYVSGDVGVHLINTSGFKLGPFIGVHRWNEKIDSYGCVPISGESPCGDTPVAANQRTDTLETTYLGLRLGAATQLRMGPWLWQAEAAYVRADLDAQRTSWTTNLFNGATPMHTRADGLQLESVLSYRFKDGFSLGVGGRYWKYEPADGLARYDQTLMPVGVVGPQKDRLSLERYGAFLQAGIQF